MYGGIYLDFGMAFLQSFDSLLDSDLVMGLDSDTASTSLSNTLIIAAKDSNILNKWLNLYSTSNTSLWRINNPLLPEKLLDEYPTEIKVSPFYGLREILRALILSLLMTAEIAVIAWQFIYGAAIV